MTPSTDGTWIANTPSGVIVARLHTDGLSTVDRPALGRFREPLTPEIRGGQPIIDGTPLLRVTAMPPDLTTACGWYDSSTRRLLLTQVAEASFGEPMVFLADGDRVVRAYPTATNRLLGEDGTIVDLAPGGLRVTNDESVAELIRSPRYTERQVTFTARGSRLTGTVIVPGAVGPHPAAVLVHGAAGGQRDFCRLFAQPLLDAGVAVLIYDKPGHGQSEGSGDPSTFEQADAASAGMDLLASLPQIDPHRIGLAGFSNGMWAVPMVAARRPVAFIVGVGSPGVSMAESEVHRRTKVLLDAGVGPDTAAAAGEAWACVFGVVGSGAATDEVTQRLDRALSELAAATDLSAYEIPDYVRENPMLSPIPPLIGTDAVIAMVSGDPDPQVTHDPAADYARVRCPVLLQYGAQDTNVPVAASVREIEKALEYAGVPAVIRVYPGLEHMLNLLPDDITGLTPEAAMYGFHHFRYGEDVWQDLTHWLRQTIGILPQVDEY